MNKKSIGIFPAPRAYNNGMKKRVFAACFAVLLGFVAAVGMCIQALNAPRAVFSQAEEKLRVVVDAGHGGIDGGVTGVQTKVKESEINLAIALALKTEFEDMGFAVTLTRKTDAGLYDTTAKGFKKRDMQKRKEIILEAKPALLLSIHQNYYPSKTSRGAQVFYRRESEAGGLFAKSLQEKLNALYKEEGVKGRNAATGEYFMLECYDTPSVIVECGFLSNAKDEKLLTSNVWQKRLCQAIVAGSVDYLSHLTA